MKIYFTLVTFLSLFLLYGIYELNFSKKVEARKIVNEIETLKIDSTNSFTLGETNYLVFYLDNKYKINIETKKHKPFSEEARQKVYVIDIGGKLVMEYDTKYQYSWTAWESDYIRLMKYLNVQSK
jgi:hypothetical protein